MTDMTSNTEPMIDPYQVSYFRDAEYWKDRAEKAEKELERLRIENEEARACVQAIYMLRHANALIDRANKP